MELKFSDRLGITKPPIEFLRNSVSQDLANSLWSFILMSKIAEVNQDEKSEEFYNHVYFDYFKIPVDEIPRSRFSGLINTDGANSIIRKMFFNSVWYDKLNFTEFLFKDSEMKYHNTLNKILKREFSAYRFVDKKLVEVNSEEEINEIESALSVSDKFNPAKAHLKTALQHLANRENPDYRNSIKESLSSLESLARIILENDKITLGEALNEIERKYNIPRLIKEPFAKLYGYASNEGGIRHSLLDNDVIIEMEEARFMLITCSAFINYIISKM